MGNLFEQFLGDIKYHSVIFALGSSSDLCLVSFALPGVFFTSMASQSLSCVEKAVTMPAHETLLL